MSPSTMVAAQSFTCLLSLVEPLVSALHKLYVLPTLICSCARGGSHADMFAVCLSVCVCVCVTTVQAYRVGGNGVSSGTCQQDCDDDGETAAGGRLLHLLQVCVCVCVCVWARARTQGCTISPSSVTRRVFVELSCESVQCACVCVCVCVCVCAGCRCVGCGGGRIAMVWRCAAGAAALCAHKQHGQTAARGPGTLRSQWPATKAVYGASAVVA